MKSYYRWDFPILDTPSEVVEGPKSQGRLCFANDLENESESMTSSIVYLKIPRMRNTEADKTSIS